MLFSAEPVDVLLTYPKDGLRLFQSMIPIGLVSIGSVLKQAGYRVCIIDFNHYTNDFARHLEQLRPAIVGIGGTTPSRSGSFLTARLTRKVLPNALIVYGGVHASFTAAEVLDAIPSIDVVLKGEGEHSFLDLCNAVIRKMGPVPDDLPGICRRTKGGVTESKPERINDLGLLPIPDRDLLSDNYGLEMEFIGGQGDFIMTSRGCPAACNFCSASRMFPGGVRLRPMDSVMNEIEYLRKRKNLSGIKLFDSTFTANRDHVEQFCRHVREFKLPWECEIRADTVDESLLRLMKESGCYYINIGMETTDMVHLKHIAKGISPSQVLDTLSICSRLAIRSKVFFTFGHIDQTFGECLKDIDFISCNRHRIDFFAVTVGMRIYPGTRLEKECRDKNLLGKQFSWVKTSKRFANLLVFEPGDVPLLFQKQLGPIRLFTVLLVLLSRRLVCTERFLVRMLIENGKSIGKFFRLQIIYLGHRLERLSGRPANMAIQSKER